MNALVGEPAALVGKGAALVGERAALGGTGARVVGIPVGRPTHRGCRCAGVGGCWRSGGLVAAVALRVGGVPAGVGVGLRVVWRVQLLRRSGGGVHRVCVRGRAAGRDQAVPRFKHWPFGIGRHDARGHGGRGDGRGGAYQRVRQDGRTVELLALGGVELERLRGGDGTSSGKVALRNRHGGAVAIGVIVVRGVVNHGGAIDVGVVHLDGIARVDIGDVDAVHVAGAGVVPGGKHFTRAERKPCRDARARTAAEAY